MAITSRDRLTFSASLALMHSQVKCWMPIPAGPLRLELGELAEIIAKAVDAAAVEAGPERRLAHRDAAHLGQRLVVVGDAGDHVDVRIDVIHPAYSWTWAVSAAGGTRPNSFCQSSS